MLFKALPKVLHILVHQLKVGNPFVKLFPCHIMAGMEKERNRPGLLADDFRRAVAGQLQVCLLYTSSDHGRIYINCTYNLSTFFIQIAQDIFAHLSTAILYHTDFFAIHHDS